MMSGPCGGTELNKEKAYHQIALACLKTLRNTAASRDDAVAELHQAIDSAFQQQFALLLSELNDYRDRLKLIESLDPEQHSLADAQAIAVRKGKAH
mgnify:CR=1 FL=1